MKLEITLTDEMLEEIGPELIKKLTELAIDENSSHPYPILDSIEVANKAQSNYEFNLIVLERPFENKEQYLENESDFSVEASYINNLKVKIQDLNDHVDKCMNTMKELGFDWEKYYK